MATPPLPNETVELVEHEVAFQGYFKVGRYFFRHGLYQGGQSGITSAARCSSADSRPPCCPTTRCATRSC